MKELEALGKPRYCIVPNSHHRLDGGVYKVRYPEMMLLWSAVAAWWPGFRREGEEGRRGRRRREWIAE